MASLTAYAHRISDVEDLLATVRHMNEAIFLAAAGLGNSDHMNAFQAISDEMNSKLLAVRERLDDIREEMGNA